MPRSCAHSSLASSTTRRAVGQRRRVAGGHRVAEDRLELRELVGARVRAQVLVALEAEVGRHEVVEEAALVGGGEALVARHGQLVLSSRAMPHALGGDRLVLAHRQPGARLGVARDLGTIWPGRRWPSSFTRPATLLVRLASSSTRRRSSLTPIGASLVVSTPPAMPALDLAERDLVGHGERRLQPGVARLLDVVGGGGVVERRAEHALAREVEVPAVLEHGAGDDLAGALALQPEAGDEPVERGGEHVLVGGLGVGAVRAGERDPVAAEDRDLRRPSCLRTFPFI